MEKLIQRRNYLSNEINKLDNSLKSFFKAILIWLEMFVIDLSLNIMR